MKKARKVVGLCLRGKIDDIASFLVGEIQQLAQRSAPRRLRDTDLGYDEIAEMAQNILCDVPQIEPLLGDSSHHVDARRGVTGGQSGRQLVKDLAVGDTKHTRDVVARQASAAEGDHLVEKAHRIAHRSRGFAGEHLNRGGLGLDRLEPQHLLKA